MRVGVDLHPDSKGLDQRVPFLPSNTVLIEMEEEGMLRESFLGPCGLVGSVLKLPVLGEGGFLDRIRNRCKEEVELFLDWRQPSVIPARLSQTLYV